jgi:hypothetical protein
MRVVVLLLAALAVSVPAAAQQTLNFSLGYFMVNGEDARADGDVLLVNREFLLFDMHDFDTWSVGGEWLVPIGDYVEAGGGVQFTSRTVNTIYADYEEANGAEIEQELKLRIIPLTATARVLPLGRRAAVQPYVGAGIGFFNWRYSENGDFIDFTVFPNEIYRARYVDSGTSVGPVAIFGVRAPIGKAMIGGEVRYQKAEGELGQDFLGTRIDLGGWHYIATFGFRF